MATLTAGQIYSLAHNAGLGVAPATIATAVAIAESGGRTDAMGDVALENATWGPSVGLWQIRSLKAQSGTGQPRDASKLTDPVFNAQSMASISGMGKNFGAWTTFTSGKYKANLPAATGAASTGGMPGWLQSLLTGGISVGGSAGDVGEKTGEAAAAVVSGWSGDALTLGIKILAGATAAGLFIVGAVHAVSGQGATS